MVEGCLLEELDEYIKIELQENTRYSELFNICFHRVDYIDALQIFFNNGHFLKWVQFDKPVYYNRYDFSITENLIYFELFDAIVAIVQNYHLFMRDQINYLLKQIRNKDVFLSLDECIFYQLVDERLVAFMLIDIRPYKEQLEWFNFFITLNPYLDVSKLLSFVLRAYLLTKLTTYILDNYDILLDSDVMRNLVTIEKGLFRRMYPLVRMDDCTLAYALNSAFVYGRYSNVKFLLSKGAKFNTDLLRTLNFRIIGYRKISIMFDISIKKQIDVYLTYKIFYQIVTHVTTSIKDVINWLFWKYPDEYKYIFRLTMNQSDEVIKPEKICSPAYTNLLFAIPGGLNYLGIVENIPRFDTPASWKFGMISLINEKS